MYNKQNEELCSAISSLVLICVAASFIAHIFPYLLIAGVVALAILVGVWLFKSTGNNNKHYYKRKYRYRG